MTEPLDIKILRYLKSRIAEEVSVETLHSEINKDNAYTLEQLEQTLKALYKEDRVKGVIYSGSGGWKFSLSGITKDGLVLLRQLDGDEPFELFILEYLKPRVASSKQWSRVDFYNEINQVSNCEEKFFYQTLNVLQREDLIEGTPNMWGDVIVVEGIARDGLRLLRKLGL